MKKLIQKILQQKKLGLTVITIIIAIICVTVYTLLGIRHSVEKMAEVNEVTFYPEYPRIDTTGKNAEVIKRGEYLVKAGDCIACHTNTTAKEKGPAFAGGLPMRTPFGTIYSPNITPDKETGIGSWTDEQFIKAMREGISPKGHYYYPAFPYLYFNRVSTEDLKAMKVYLDSLPAIKQENRKNEMVFPFNIRLMQLGWRILFFYPENTGAFKPHSDQSELWNRGAYLAEGLGHCAMCHSPSYHILSENLSLGAPIRKYDLTGAKIQGFLAPNITQANLEKVPIQEIIDVFTKDHMIGGGKVEGPMLEANRDSLRYLSQSDLTALATYLKSVQSEAPPKPTGDNLGKGIYETYCSGCHAAGAGGAPKYADAAGWDAIMKQGLDKVYANAIQGKGGMPAKGTCLSCSDDEIKQAVDYMVAAIQGHAGKEPTMTKPKRLTLEEGKQIYAANCGICHDSGFKNAPKPGDMTAWKPYIDAGFLTTYHDVLLGHKHPPHGACDTCSDSEIKAAVKYMMQESSTGKDYSLW
ncbi:MAG: c-type cytochrome [Gammaproteobacteria bacterium]